MDIIEQQTHHLPPPEDTMSSATANTQAKQDGTSTNATT
jgi:hypothetical protein